jgi:hypothetical protein
MDNHSDIRLTIYAVIEALLSMKTGFLAIKTVQVRCYVTDGV